MNENGAAWHVVRHCGADLRLPTVTFDEAETAVASARIAGLVGTVSVVQRAIEILEGNR